MFYSYAFVDLSIQELSKMANSLISCNEILTGCWFIFKKEPVTMYSEELQGFINEIKSKSSKFYFKFASIDENSRVLSVEMIL